MRHFLTVIDHSPEVLRHLLDEARRLKAEIARGQFAETYKNKIVGLVFEKPSLRTRVSFEAGVAQLGGTSLFQAGGEVGLGVRESLADFARTMSQFVNVIILRVFKHTTVVGVAEASKVPVVNGLSDTSHPCQAMADLQTMEECFGDLKGRTLTFIGDGNNVARSLAVACGKLGVKFILSCPPGYGFPADFAERYRKSVGGQLPPEIRDPAEAVRNTDVIYTDVWTSMGQEAEREQRLREFAAYQVNGALLKKAPKHAKVLHCLPAHRDEEITNDVIEGPASVVFQQAGNRMHAQKAILEWLLG
ncbi:ornithine carbamoyltransferase [Zavarzinella formosa]|uniref:ornithine carbamoyltransferase n=1 Tax=Zavarzinella formosa TaxID=360055 RepID=UPI0002D508B0|nr:ornithine carbamoyltransferase [Zavarzinella formosa]